MREEKKMHNSASPSGSVSAMDIVNGITAGFPHGWAEDLEEPEELSQDDLPGWK